MAEKITITDSASLKKLFQTEKNQNSPYIYLPIDSKDELNTREKLSRLISGYKKSGFGGIVPFCNKNYSIDALTEEY